MVVAVTVVLGLAVGGLFGADAAYAADTITITPATSSTSSNTPVTYTLTVSCSTTGGCASSTVSFPTTALTGDGSTTDFASWVSNSTCPAMTKPAGQVVFTYGTVATGTQSCNFTVRPTVKTTLNGATATITPTFTNSGGAVTASTPAVLTATAGHTDGLGAGASPTNVVGGANLTLTFTFGCGTNTTQAGDLTLSALTITDSLPSNFTFTGLSTAPIAGNLQGTITTPAPGASGGTIGYSGNGSDCTNPANNRIVFTVTGTASAGGVADAPGATITHSASATYTYIDGFSDSKTAQAMVTVIDVDFQSGKGVVPKTMGNHGQYKAIDNTTPSLYTFPGDWDSSGGDTVYNLTASSKPAVVNAGLSYDIKDPLPCLDSPSGASYLSNAPGVACAHPAYVPKAVTVTGFTPANGAAINLLFADGTTGTAAYVSGTGWTLPTSPAISEIDIPTFTQEGLNSGAIITFTVSGYASATVPTGHILTNTDSVTAFLAGTSTQVKTPQQSSATVLVADPTANGTGAQTIPGFAATYSSACVARIQPSGTTMEITQAPSQAIYLDYLAPVGVGTITIPALTLTLTGANGHTYTATGITPATQTADWNGTGRTRVEWTIPAGLAAVPGLYTLGMTGFNVALPAGCSGTYQNAMTFGYGTAIPYCVVPGGLQAPPVVPSSDPALNVNGSPIAGNFCGAATTFSVTATNPGFKVGKSVQGNLDASPVSSGGIGKVSPTGGTATYTVTFANTGQSNLHDPVMYDLLPRVGDTEATSTTVRGSSFPVTLTNVPAPPSGVTISYSTAVNPCRPEVLANASNPGCVDDWSTTAPTPLSDTTAIRIAYDGTVGVSGSPFTQSFNVAYDVSTPATTVGDVAWNTVGTNVHTGDTGDPTVTTDLLGAAESSRTGLAASSNSPAVVKGASVTAFSTLGETITYTFDVTNTEAVALSSAAVVDGFTDAPAGAVAPLVTCQSLTTPAGACSGSTTPLQPGQTAHFTASYVVTQADLDHATLTDIATVTAQPAAGGAALVNTSNPVTVVALAAPALTLDKTASRPTVSSTADVVTYSFLVTNVGNQTLHGITVDDPMLTAINCPVTTLAPAATTACTGDYATTQADLDAGSIHNTATASALDPANSSLTSAPSSVTVNAAQGPALALTKSADRTTVGKVGDIVAFSFLVTNTGNVTVTTIAIDDPMLPTVTCPAARLAPTDDETCSADYTVTQADVDAGSIVNTATATGTAPAAVVSDPSTVTVSVDPPAGVIAVVLAQTGIAGIGTGIDSAMGLLVLGMVVLVLRRRRGRRA